MRKNLYLIDWQADMCWPCRDFEKLYISEIWNFVLIVFDKIFQFCKVWLSYNNKTSEFLTESVIFEIYMLYYEKTADLKTFRYFKIHIHKFVVCCLLWLTISKGSFINYVTTLGVCTKDSDLGVFVMHYESHNGRKEFKNGNDLGNGIYE